MEKIKRYSINITIPTMSELTKIKPFEGLHVFVEDIQQFWYWDKSRNQFILEGGSSGGTTPTLQQVTDEGHTTTNDIIINSTTIGNLAVNGKLQGNLSVTANDPTAVTSQINIVFSDTVNSSNIGLITDATSTKLSLDGASNIIERLGDLKFNIGNSTTNTITASGTMTGTAATNPNEFIILSQSNLQNVTENGNTTSKAILIQNNENENTNHGLHLSYNPSSGKSFITNIDADGNSNTTVITLDLHNMEFFTQTGFRILGLNDQQSGGLAGANFNCRVKGEGAFLTNEFITLGQSTANGTTANRPGSPITGQFYFDTTLTKPIWYSGSNWVDATGTTV